MEPSMLESYVEKVYGYAVKHTFSQDEADELSQEILLAAVKALPKLQKEGSFEPWLWGIARNVTHAFSRKRGKERQLYLYDMPKIIAQDADEEQEEQLHSLRKKVAMLSKMYREIILLYYYDALSTKEIAARLGIPEGTVTWRLMEGRRKIRREFDEMEEKALRPRKMRIDIYGIVNINDPAATFPIDLISDALSQSILLYCYDQARTVEEIAQALGVPAYYVEERMENLERREAILQQKKGKYRTDFAILSDEHLRYYEENAEKALLPLLPELMDALQQMAHEAQYIPFYRAGKEEKDLWYLYGMLAFDNMSAKHCPLPYPAFRKRDDGYAWRYLGNVQTKKHHSIGIGTQHSANREGRGRLHHTCYNGVPGTAWRNMMRDSCINVCEDILYMGKTDDVYTLADAIREGYIKRTEEGAFFVTTPAFTLDQRKAFDAITEKYMQPLVAKYNECMERFAAGYKKLFPRHLWEDADRLSQNMYKGMFAVVAAYAQREGLMDCPSEGCHLDVLQQWKE